MYTKSFGATEQAWSTFERELYGLKESLVACDKFIKGFPEIVYTDHKNNLFTGGLLANKRLQKKLLRWTLEIEELGTLVRRVWLAGKDNVLGDGPSRNPPDRDEIKDLPVPAGPIKRVVRAMFEKTIQLDEEMSALNEFLGRMESAVPLAQPSKPDEAEGPTSEARGRLLKQEPLPENEEADRPEETGRGNTADAQALLPEAPLGLEGKAPFDLEGKAPKDSEGNSDDPTTRAISPSLEVSHSSMASWPNSLDDEMLICVYGGGAEAASWSPTKRDGCRPDFPFASFLPFEEIGPEGNDPRLPRWAGPLPLWVSIDRLRERQVYTVTYAQPVRCHDGRNRRTMGYPSDGSAVGILAAWKGAIRHCDEALRAQLEEFPEEPKHGSGPLHFESPLSFHGTRACNVYDTRHPFFNVHPKPSEVEAPPKSRWSPFCNTFEAAEVFCTNCRYERKDGRIEVWECLGHEMAKPREPARASSRAPRGPDSTVKGRKMLDLFSGSKSMGGGRLANAWQEAGGEATSRDILLDADHNVLTDNDWWESVLKDPPEWAHFAPPSSGDAADSGKREVALKAINRMLELLLRGRGVSFEAPLESYLWELPEVKAVVGTTGMHLVRIDQCVHGAPFKRPQLWLTNAAGLDDEGKTCYHPRGHPGKVAETHARQGAPYPRQLAAKVVDAWDRWLHQGTPVPEALIKTAVFLRTGTKTAFRAELEKLGAYCIARLRAGHECASGLQAAEALRDELETGPVATPDEPEAALKGCEPLRLHVSLVGGPSYHAWFPGSSLEERGHDICFQCDLVANFAAPQPFGLTSTLVLDLSVSTGDAC